MTEPVARLWVPPLEADPDDEPPPRQVTPADAIRAALMADAAVLYQCRWPGRA